MRQRNMKYQSHPYAKAAGRGARGRHGKCTFKTSAAAASNVYGDSVFPSWRELRSLGKIVLAVFAFCIVYFSGHEQSTYSAEKVQAFSADTATPDMDLGAPAAAPSALAAPAQSPAPTPAAAPAPAQSRTAVVYVPVSAQQHGPSYNGSPSGGRSGSLSPRRTPRLADGADSNETRGTAGDESRDNQNMQPRPAYRLTGVTCNRENRCLAYLNGSVFYSGDMVDDQMLVHDITINSVTLRNTNSGQLARLSL